MKNVKQIKETKIDRISIGTGKSKLKTQRIHKRREWWIIVIAIQWMSVLTSALACCIFDSNERIGKECKFN